MKSCTSLYEKLCDNLSFKRLAKISARCQLQRGPLVITQDNQVYISAYLHRPGRIISAAADIQYRM